ncbi:MAG: hypothetical protein JJT88_03290 [Gammaproteobacteria bacterium]|nr:hypothetical protein [Gammaproteobacteria bacterium]
MKTTRSSWAAAAFAGSSQSRFAEDQALMSCVAMGYPDDRFPANAVVSRRRPVAEIARFMGFEEA